jgi:DNA-binding NarL/FixJ family response regulator
MTLASHAGQEGLVMVEAKLGGAGGREDPLSGLTEQERTLLELLSEGLSNRQIAGRMFLAEKTVKNYVSRLLAKLGMERRTQAAVFASRLALRSGQPTIRTTAPPTGR